MNSFSSQNPNILVQMLVLKNKEARLLLVDFFPKVRKFLKFEITIISKNLTIMFLLIASKNNLGFRTKLGVFLEIQILVVEIENQVKSNF